MIRNFLYADSEKIRSISSQLFEGVTERFILSEENSKQESESQKASIASGRILGDIFSQTSQSSELKFLEDYAYTILEDRLHKDQLLEDIDSQTNNFLTHKNFVKVTAHLNINDLRATADTLTKFNGAYIRV